MSDIIVSMLVGTVVLMLIAPGALGDIVGPTGIAIGGVAAALLTVALLGAWTPIGLGLLRTRTLSAVLATVVLALLVAVLLLDITRSAAGVMLAGALAWGTLLALGRSVLVDRSVPNARNGFIVAGRPESVARLSLVMEREGYLAIERVSFVSHASAAEVQAAIERATARAPFALPIIAPPEHGALAGAGTWRLASALPTCAVIPTGTHDVAATTGRMLRLGSLCVVVLRSRRAATVPAAVKRIIDVTASAIGLVLLLPLLVAIAALIAITSRGSILYRQTRVGRYGQEFSCLKFRTMHSGPAAGPGADEPIDVAVDRIKREEETRTTAIGAWLRRYGLDELPQLVNVLVGNMSLVGPRPLRHFEVASLDDQGRARLLVRPGITGTWQAYGRNAIRWEERMLMDETYAATWTLRSDLVVLARTLVTVPQGRGR